MKMVRWQTSSNMCYFFCRILDYNSVQVITKGWLFELSKLSELSISSNKIHRIETDAWEFCQELSIL